MSISTLFLLGALVALAILFHTLISYLLNKKPSPEVQEKRERKQAELEAKQKAEQQRLNDLYQKKLEIIRKKGGILADELNKYSSISADKLNVLYLAATQQDIHFDLETEQKFDIVPYPATRMNFVQLNQVSQLPYVSPNQMVYDDDLFYHKFITDQLVRPEYYDVVEKFKRLYILWDISPSMWQTMALPSGEVVLRDTWARSVLASLLVDASRGRAEYLLRPFAGRVHDLLSAKNPSEAACLLTSIVNSTAQAPDTNIGGAIAQASQDIRARQTTDARMSRILLITDGDDNSLTRAALEKVIGSDVKLHVVLIGVTYNDNHPLAPYVIKKY